MDEDERFVSEADYYAPSFGDVTWLRAQLGDYSSERLLWEWSENQWREQQEHDIWYQENQSWFHDY